jgi:hypothetical protein
MSAMDMTRIFHRFRGYRALVACVLAAALPACEQTQNQTGFGVNPNAAKKEPKPPLKEVYVPPDVSQSNIVQVTKFFGEFPWLSFSSGEAGTIDGFKCALYLSTPTSQGKGVFGSGTLVIEMYRLDNSPQGETATLVQTWELPPQDLYMFQSTKPTMLGWGYGLRLRWDEKVDVRGRKIALLIKFIREDGRIVHAQRQVLRVPLYGDTRGPVITGQRR